MSNQKKFLVEVYDGKKRVFQSVIYDDDFELAKDTAQIEKARHGGDKGLVYKYWAIVPCFVC